MDEGAASLRRLAPPPPEWRSRPELGNRALLGLMARVSLRLGRPFGRLLLGPIGLWYLLFAPRVRACTADYLSRVLARAPRPRERLRLLTSFASSILDRLYLLAGRDELFDVSLEGESVVREAAREGGTLLFGAHVGSFEILRLIGRRRGLAVTMAMYEDNARKLHGILASASPAPPDVIPVGRVDSVLKIRACLDRGAMVGILADRRFGDEPTIPVSFLGEPARFPTNPMRLAALLRRRVVFMLALYRGGNRYHVVFEPLADFGRTPARLRARAVEAAVVRYVGLLERHCRSDPYNWFNFYDFWRDGQSAPASGAPRP